VPEAKTYAVVSPAEARAAQYPYVYVNDDGSVRELHASERQYLEEAFSPFDGGRPYVKGSFDARDGWGSIKGFCQRSEVPGDLLIAPAPAEDPSPPMTKEQHVAWLKEKMVGFEVIEKPDGSVEMKRKPGSPTATTPRIANQTLQRTGAAVKRSWFQRLFGRGPGR